MEFIIINIVCGIFSFLIFPTSFTIYCHLDFDSKRLNFGVFVLGFIKLIGGYVTINGKIVAIHVSKKKAFVFEPLKSKNAFVLRGLEQIYVYEVKVAENVDFNPFLVFLLSFYKVVLSMLYPIIYENKNLTFKNVSVLGNRNYIFLKSKIAINMLAVIIILIKSKKVGSK